MNTDRKPALPSTTAEAATWPALPTETEIYILADGRVVIADLPAELAPMAARLGTAEPCALAPAAETAAEDTEVPGELAAAAGQVLATVTPPG